MEKKHLEIQDIAPYLPYGLKWYYTGDDDDYGKILKMNNLSVNCKVSLITETNSFTIQNFDTIGFEFVPILRPMSDVEDYFEQLYGMLEHQDVTDYFDADFLDYHDHLEIEDLQNVKPETIPYGTLKVLLKHHFDVFGLIDKGLAKNMNEI